jgi:hypothetical protein
MASNLRLWWIGIVALGASGCAGGEPNAVVSVGARNLRCQRSEVETALHRESPKVREYYVGCDFMYTRVLCDKPSGPGEASACHPARPQPPCFGGGCFKENPETFEWELDESQLSRAPNIPSSAPVSVLN